MQLHRFQEHAGHIEAVLQRQLFFIVGSPKSGTTWLQNLLDSHPAIICSGEGHFIPQLGQFYTQALKRYQAKQQHVVRAVYQGKGFYDPISADEFRFVTVSHAALILHQRLSRAADPERIRCLGDKTPNAVLHLTALRAFFPSAKIIHIIRDGRDILVSRLHHGLRVFELVPRMKQPQWDFDHRTEQFAKDWACCVSHAHQFAEMFPHQMHTVRYEDLLQDTPAALSQIARFLDVSCDRATLQSCTEANTFEKMSGGRRPGQEDGSSFFRKGIAGDWKHHLNEHHRRTFDEIAGEWLVRFQYQSTQNDAGET